MSLARTALRIAAIEAFRADPVIDTLCDDRVFDSRIGMLDSAEPVPVITVFTEDDGGAAASVNNGGPPFDEVCEFLVEIAMKAVVPADGAAPAMIGVSESDAQLEATIDLLEQRSVEAITVANTPQRRLLTSAVTRRVRAYKSVRFASDETGVKLAVRMLHLTVQLKTDDRSDARTPPTGPFAALPNPLRTVAESLPEGSSGYATCQALAAALTAPTAASLLQRFGFRAGPEADAPLTADFPANPSP